MAITINLPRLQKISLPRAAHDNIWMLRLEEVHPVVSGNKWYKLQYFLADAKAQGFSSIATWGGGYSNHLVATAAAAQALGCSSVGMVRGVYEKLTPTLHQCAEWGMQLRFLTKTEFAFSKKHPAAFLDTQSCYFIPEGGGHDLGRQGAATIASFLPGDVQCVCVSVGSGTTLAGLRAALPETVRVIGFAPMKGGAYLKEEVQGTLHTAKKLELIDEFHYGGFGKYNEAVLQFIESFHRINGIVLDVVYTAKMMMGVEVLLQRQIISPFHKTVCIHTGGLQGNIGAPLQGMINK